MYVRSLDTETAPIEPGILTPELVAVQIGGPDSVWLYDAKDGIFAARTLLADPDCIIVGANIAYDFGVLCAADPSLTPMVFKAYRAHRIRDVQIRQMLMDLAAGTFRDFFNQSGTKTRAEGYSLADLSFRWLGRDMVKGEDSWQLRFVELLGKPVEEWPEEAKVYALGDVRVTYDILKAQNDSLEAPLEESITDEIEQAHSAWVLHLMSVWGVRTDRRRIEALERKLRRHADRVVDALTHRGIYRWKGPKKDPKRKRSKDTKLIQSYVRGILGQGAPLTPTGLPVCDEETLLYAAKSGLGKPATKKMAKELRALARVSGDQKLLSAFVPGMKAGCDHPICARFRVLVSSGRTSCSGPNLQQLPRKPGVRECYLPRPGFVYVSSDYDIFELRTLAQALLWMFGQSAMAEQLQAGRELHLAFAAQLLRSTYEETLAAYEAGSKEAKSARNMAKVANFGIPGGLGAESLVSFAAGYRITLSVEEAQGLKQAWLSAFPEMRKFFRVIGDLVGDDVGTLKQFVSDRLRGGVGYTDACNSVFQGLAADAAKAALRQAAWEAYVDAASPFYGSRPVVFIHDEILAEVPLERAHEAATRLGEIMCEAAKPYLPDIPVTASPCLMTHWSKEAETVRDAAGRLLVWTPQIAA